MTDQPTPADLPVAYVNPDGRPHYAAAYDALRTAEREGRVNLAAVLIRMMTAAGAISRWDSGTIESVLGQVKSTLDVADLPWVGDTFDDYVHHAFWANIAEDLGWDHDYEPEDEPDGEDEDDDTDA